MISRSTQFGLMALLAAAPLVATACGSSPSGHDAQDETTSTSSAKITDSQRFVLGGFDVSAIVHAVALSDCTLALVNGQVVFTESSALAKLQFPADPEPTHHLTTVPVTSIPVPFPDPFSNGSASLTSLRLISLDAALSNNTLDVTGKLAGVLHVHTPQPLPDFDVVIDSLEMVASFHSNYNPLGVYGANLGVSNLTVKVRHHLQGCDGFAWCLAVVEGNLPDLEKMLHDKVLPVLRYAVAKPDAQAAFVQTLNAFSNARVPAGEPQWSADLAYGIDMSGGTINWNASRVLPPTVPQNCHADTLCSGVDFRCTSTADPFLLQRLDPSSVWITVATDYDVSRQMSPFLTDWTPPAQATTAEYRVCTANAANTLCTAPYVVPLSHGLCAGGGGGGLTTCSLGYRMCNGTCISKKSPCSHVE